jgi:ribosomal RNA-processing protein 7
MPSTLNVAAEVNDFLALPLTIPAQTSFQAHATHYLYLRANAPKVPTEDTPRELFLINVPIDATEQHIKHLFATQLGGRIENVAFESARVGKGIAAPVAPVQKSKKRKRVDEAGALEEEVGLLPDTWERRVTRSGSSAIATFVDRESRDLALKQARRAIKNKKKIVWYVIEGQRGLPRLGSARYATHHKLRYPDHAALETSVNVFMAAFAAKEEARAKQLARLRNEPDEDGFITVTRGGRKGPGREEEARAKEEELKKREKSRIRPDFYRFQVREKKKEEAKDLVKGFEEDMRRVEEMKRRRGRIRPE